MTTDYQQHKLEHGRIVFFSMGIIYSFLMTGLGVYHGMYEHPKNMYANVAMCGVFFFLGIVCIAIVAMHLNPMYSKNYKLARNVMRISMLIMGICTIIGCLTGV